MCAIEKKGYAKITFPNGTFTSDTDVKVSISTDSAISDIFNETAVMFRPNGRLSYEVQVSVEEPPDAETVHVVLNVPDPFLRLVANNDTIEVFTLRENAGGEELPSTLFEIEEEGVKFNATTKTIEFDLPGAAFLLSNSNGFFIAVITLSFTPGGSMTTRRLASDGCEGVSISCPLAGGCIVTSPFQKNRKHPTKKGTVRDHLGTDYRAAVGTSVLAAASGTIERSYISTSYGETIILRHSDGSATLYAHLSIRNVKAGDAVDLGQEIGKSGNTGESEAPHLHFEYVPNGEIIQSKSRIDPDACVGVLVAGSIEVGDNGLLADDAFEISLNGLVLGKTTIGGANTLSTNNLIPSMYELTLETIVAPDDAGTWFIRLNDNITFVDGGTYRSSTSPLGGIVTFTIVVPSKA